MQAKLRLDKIATLSKLASRAASSLKSKEKSPKLEKSKKICCDLNESNCSDSIRETSEVGDHTTEIIPHVFMDTSRFSECPDCEEM